MDVDSPFADRNAETPMLPDVTPEEPAFTIQEDVTAEDVTAAAVTPAPESTDAITDPAEVEEALRDTVPAIGESVGAAAPGPAPASDDTPAETTVKCAKCGTKAKWPGALTADMLERTFTRGVSEATGLPNCVHCGSAMDRVEPIPVADAMAQAAQALDAERAGNAARPLVQPSIPGIHPPFDWRRAQLTTESLEQNVADAERLWESAKKEATKCKTDFDDAVEALRDHIQATHRARVDAEFEARRGPAPNATASESSAATTAAAPCVFEHVLKTACPICSNSNAAIVANRDAVSHIASAAAVGTLDPLREGLTSNLLAEAIYQVTGMALGHSDVLPWDGENRKTVGGWLEQWALAQERGDDPRQIARPELLLGRQHEAGDPDGEHQMCRVCGARLTWFKDGVGRWATGQLVGIDCSGEPAAEPARRPAKRHATAESKKAALKKARAEAAPAAAAPTKKKPTKTRKQ